MNLWLSYLVVVEGDIVTLLASQSSSDGRDGVL